MKKVKSLGTTRQGKKYKTYRGTAKDKNCIVEIPITSQKICVSDADKEAVVVVAKSGQYRFSYTGQESEFDPWGICTDKLGHIIVCDNYSDKVHLLDQEGHLLSLLLTDKQGIYPPLSVCVDDEYNLHLGQWDTNKVTVFKYLQ